MRIAVGTLPKTALVDTGVFLRFLGDRAEEPKSLACKAFCQAMLASHREIFIASATITEVTRWRGSKLPRVQGITVVPFDDRAAEWLGIKGPENTITTIMKADGITRNCIRYDFMIAACAARANAEVLISLDTDIPKICSHLGIAHKRPEEYEEHTLLKLAPSPTAAS